MNDSIKDLEIQREDSLEIINDKIHKKLGIELFDMMISLSKHVESNAHTLAEEFNGLAPHGDYGDFLETKPEIVKFLKEEGCKPENWHLKSLSQHKEDSNQIMFEFVNLIVDDGDSFIGYVAVSLSGNIRHVFVHNKL